jgi:hypothetical protein
MKLLALRRLCLIYYYIVQLVLYRSMLRKRYIRAG